MLTEQQIENMSNQYFAWYINNIYYKIPRNPGYDETYDVSKNDVLNSSKKIYELIVKDLNLCIKEEKRTLVWLLKNFMFIFKRIEEDAKTTKENLKVYFENRREIKKDIYS
jgi:hypothetical protein